MASTTLGNEIDMTEDNSTQICQASPTSNQFRPKRSNIYDQFTLIDAEEKYKCNHCK